MKRFCTVLFSAAVLLAAVLSASCSDGSSGSSGGGDTAQVPGGGTAAGAGEEGGSSGSGWELITVPSAPENVTATASGSSSITVSWDAVDGADSYVVYYRLSLNSSEYGERLGTETTKTTENTSVLIQGLTEYKVYGFWVTAKNSAGESRESNVKFAAPYTTTTSGGGSSGSEDSGTLSAPTGLTAVEDSSSRIRLSWNSVKGATGYEVYSSIFSSPSYASLYTTTTSTSAIISGNNANTTYYFWVKAINGTTKSNWSSYDYVTTKGSSSSQSKGTLTVINNSSYAIKNVQIYTTYNASSSGVLLGLDVVIAPGDSKTFTNITPGTYVRLGSETYRSHKVSAYKTVTVNSGSTTTLTITNSDIISN